MGNLLDDDILVIGSGDQFLKRRHLRDDDTATAAVAAMTPECGVMGLGVVLVLQLIVR